MALNDTTADALGTAIADALLAMPGSPSAEARWQAAMRLVYAALKTDAVVNVASVTGVTVGAGVSGPGTGTIS